MEIKNFVQVTSTIASSGQPLREEFELIANEGYQTVINLAMASSDNAVPEEGELVTALGMTYIHLPVLWENPTVEQFRLFAAIMDQQQGARVWIHCALNLRVSVFLYLYRTFCLKQPEPVVREQLLNMWEPNNVWWDFIDCVRGVYLGEE